MNKNKMTWAWLGGFFQAEGSIFCTPPKLSICQVTEEPLIEIKEFVQCHQAITSYVHQNSFIKNHKMFQLNITDKASVQRILLELYPHLHFEKQAKASILLEQLSDEHLDYPIYSNQLSDDWLLGFWEGDGTITRNPQPRLIISQKDELILQKIKTYLGFGCIVKEYQKKYATTSYKLILTVSKKHVDYFGTLLSKARLSKRCTQLTNLHL